MIDLSKISYRAAVIDESGNQYNIKEYIHGLGWEENKNEIAVRSSFTVRNDKTSVGKLSSLIKPGCLVGIFATDGVHDDEVARGYVAEWNPTLQNSSDDLKCTNYDKLYDLQKSQDNRFYSSGTGTQSIITGLLDDYEIPTKGYSGPNVSHGKLKYNSSYGSDIILDVLDDVKKKVPVPISYGRRKGMQMSWSVEAIQMFMYSRRTIQNPSATQSAQRSL